MTARVALKRTISESAWQSRVVEFARWNHWLCVHIRNVKVDGRYTVPYDGDPGLPDLVLARGGVTLLVELKRQTGRLTPGQADWIRESGGYCWRPSDWLRVQEVLR